MTQAIPHAREWSAAFIAGDGDDGPAPVFRREFRVEGAIRSASLTATFLGIGTVRINGHVVGDHILEPGWQSYSHRLVYSSYDVSDFLVDGVNVIQSEVGAGWYSGRLGFLGQRSVYGRDRAAFVELEIRHRDGSLQKVASDKSWTWAPGSTLAADLYDGETYDARQERNTAPQRAVRVVDYDLDQLEPRLGPPVRRIGSLSPQKIFATPAGKTIVDFGRNVVGWTKIRVRGSRGTEVQIRHAEVLEHGELGIRPLRTAVATDRYILAGGGADEVWEPSFTYHGFRYVEVEGWPGVLDPSEIEAVIIQSDMPRSGWFRTSHPQLATLHENVVSSTSGNFVSIPTDCPQRDERLGWTGDIAVFAPTACFLFDATDFLRSWLRDVALEQRDDGRIPIFVPEVPFPPEAAIANAQFREVRASVWGDAATLVPSAIYEAIGDARVLAENFSLMRRWVDGVAQAVGPSRIWSEGFQFGDWLDPNAPSDSPAAGSTDPALISTAFFAHSARLLAKAAEVLARFDEQRQYNDLADEVSRAFRRTFLTVNGQLTSDSQTAHAVALCLDLLDTAELRTSASARLVELVRSANHHIGTGFVGTPLILQALTIAGAIDDAYQLLMQEDNPSWMYAVNMGATTIWERWDSMLPDGSVNPGEMTSFNHYALGSVARWLHETVAGIAPDSAGYRRIRIAPRPRRSLNDAGATHMTPYGIASVDWRWEGELIVLEATIPEGTTAVFDLEGLELFERGPGTHVVTFSEAANLDRDLAG